VVQTVYTAFDYTRVPHPSNTTEANMPKKDESKIFSGKKILVIGGAIIAGIALAAILKEKEEAKPVKLNFPKEWQQ
jgi:hypothetical protein